jgi:hypothetical protein
MHNPGSNGRKYAQPWIQWPEVCTTLDPMAGSMHNPGSQGQQYAQPWIQGQQYADVCIHLENVCKQRPAVCKRLHTFGERLQTKASSMQTSANIRRTSANQGQQLRFPAGRLAVVIHGDLVGVRSSEVLRASLQLRFPAGRLEFDRVINAGPGLDAVPSMDGIMGRKYCLNSKNCKTHSAKRKCVLVVDCSHWGREGGTVRKDPRNFGSKLFCF